MKERRNDMSKTFFFLSTLIIFIFFLSCSTGVNMIAITNPDGSVSVAQRNDIPQMTFIAGELQKSQPEPNWETVFKGQAADGLFFLPNDKLLLSVVKFKGVYDHPYSTDLIVLNIHDGNQVWSYTRKELQMGYNTLLVTDPVILDEAGNDSRSQFTALDPDSGTILWEYECTAPNTNTIDQKNNQLIVGILNADNLDLHTLQLETGREQWNLKIPYKKSDIDKAQLLNIVDNRLYIPGNETVMIEIQDGQLLWKVQFAEEKDASPEEILSVVPNQVVGLYNENRITVFDVNSGSQLWVYEPKNKHIHLATAYPIGVFVYCYTLQDGDNVKGTLTAMHPQTGKIMWQQNTLGEVQSPFMYYPDLLVYATSKELIALDGLSGRQRFKSQLPWQLWTEGKISEIEKQDTPYLYDNLITRGGSRHILPAMLKFAPGKVYITREGDGLAAYSLDKGKLLYYLEPEDEPSLFSYCSYFRVGQLETVSETLLKKKKELEQHDRMYKEIRRQLSNSFFRTTQNVGQDIFKREYLVKDNTDIPVFRLDAASRQMQNQSYEEWATQIGASSTRQYVPQKLFSAMKKFDASQQLRLAIINLTVSLVETMKKSSIQAMSARKQYDLTSSIKAHAASFQENYFIRPFRKWGKGLCLSNLDNGKRTDFFYTPYSYVFDNLYSITKLDMPCYAINPEQGILVITGISLDTAGYKQYVCDQTLTAYPSVMCYKLSDLKFSKGKRDNISVVKAAEEDDIETVKKLITAGADANSRDHEGHTPLMQACRNLNVSLVSYLLQSGADPNLRSTLGNSLFHVIAGVSCGGSIEQAQKIVTLLLSDGVDIDAKSGRGYSIQAYALKQTPQFVSILQDAGVTFPKPKTIFDALRMNDKEELKRFLAEGEDPDLLWPGSENCLLIYAVSHGLTDIVKILISHNADVSAFNKKTLQTPLHAAALGGHSEIIKMLLKAGSKVNITRDYEVTPLMDAVTNGNIQAVRLLIEAGADLDLQNRFKKTSLWLAAEKGNEDIVKLLTTNGADLEIRNDDDRTPLVVAAYNGHIETVKVLINAGANVNVQTKYGKSLLSYIEFFGSNKKEIIPLLKAAGAKK